jgi:hypothetical protein
VSERAPRQELAAGLRNLVGLRLSETSYPGMRGFYFVRPESPEVEWALHIQCSWRIETERHIVTGGYDTFEPAVPDADPEEDLEPSKGGGLGELRLRDLFNSHDLALRKIVSSRTDFVCTEALLEEHGDATLSFSGGYKLRLFPTGSRGEHWRVFALHNLERHVVCSADTSEQTT